MSPRKEQPYEITFQGVRMFCRKPGEGDTDWRPALFHDQVRQQLIDAAKGPNNYGYAHPRTSGKEATDVTAFHMDQWDWGEDRPFRPKILFQFDAPQDRKDPDYKFDIMILSGHILLDPDNRPIRNFREIPLTVSSQVEGWLMEAIRRQNSQITANDFRARMPRDPSGKNQRDYTGKWTGAGKDTLCTSGSIDMRMTRWRMKHRCVAWVEKAGSVELRNYLWKKMTQHQRATNSTEGMEDVTNPVEMKLIESLNKGKYPARAKNRKAAEMAGSTQEGSSSGEALGDDGQMSGSAEGGLASEEDPEEDDEMANSIEAALEHGDARGFDGQSAARRKTWHNTPYQTGTAQPLYPPYQPPPNQPNYRPYQQNMTDPSYQHSAVPHIYPNWPTHITHQNRATHSSNHSKTMHGVAGLEGTSTPVDSQWLNRMKRKRSTPNTRDEEIQDGCSQGGNVAQSPKRTKLHGTNTIAKKSKSRGTAGNGKGPVKSNSMGNRGAQVVPARGLAAGREALTSEVAQPVQYGAYIDPSLLSYINSPFDPTLSSTHNSTFAPNLDPISDHDHGPALDPNHNISFAPHPSSSLNPNLSLPSDPTPNPTFAPNFDSTFDYNLGPALESTFNPTLTADLASTTNLTFDPTITPDPNPTLDPTFDIDFEFIDNTQTNTGCGVDHSPASGRQGHPASRETYNPRKYAETVLKPLERAVGEYMMRNGENTEADRDKMDAWLKDWATNFLALSKMGGSASKQPLMGTGAVPDGNGISSADTGEDTQRKWINDQQSFHGVSGNGEGGMDSLLAAGFENGDYPEEDGHIDQDRRESRPIMNKGDGDCSNGTLGVRLSDDGEGAKTYHLPVMHQQDGLGGTLTHPAFEHEKTTGANRDGNSEQALHLSNGQECTDNDKDSLFDEDPNMSSADQDKNSLFDENSSLGSPAHDKDSLFDEDPNLSSLDNDKASLVNEDLDVGSSDNDLVQYTGGFPGAMEDMEVPRMRTPEISSARQQQTMNIGSGDDSMHADPTLAAQSSSLSAVPETQGSAEQPNPDGAQAVINWDDPGLADLLNGHSQELQNMNPQGFAEQFNLEGDHMAINWDDAEMIALLNQPWEGGMNFNDPELWNSIQ